MRFIDTLFLVKGDEVVYPANGFYAGEHQFLQKLMPPYIFRQPGLADDLYQIDTGEHGAGVGTHFDVVSNTEAIFGGPVVYFPFCSFKKVFHVGGEAALPGREGKFLEAVPYVFEPRGELYIIAGYRCFVAIPYTHEVF